MSRIKVMCELDIAERRKPQDGRVTVKTSTRMVDMRISTLPTVTGGGEPRARIGLHKVWFLN